MSDLSVSCPAMQRILVYPIGLSFENDYDEEFIKLKIQSFESVIIGVTISLMQVKRNKT